MKNVVKSIVSVLAVSAMCFNFTACNADTVSSEPTVTTSATSQQHELHITLTDMSYDSVNGVLNAELTYPKEVEFIGLNKESVVLYGENKTPISCTVEAVVSEETNSAILTFSDITETPEAFAITGGTGIDSEGCFVSSEVFEIN